MSANNLWQELLSDMGKTEEKETINPTVAPELQQYYNDQVNRIQNPPIETATFIDEDIEEVEEEEEEDTSLSLELGVVDTPSANNFELSLPNVAKPIAPSLDLGLVTPVQPRKVGRPPKVNTAASILSEVASGEDLSKSNSSPLSQVGSQTKETTLTVSKIKLKEIGESLCRIGNAIIEISKS